MHNPEFLIGILVPLGFFAMIFGIIYMFKKENLAMIEKGMNPKINNPGSSPFMVLKWGLLLVGSGAGLLFAYLFSEFLLPNRDNVALFFALIAIGGDLGLISSYRIEKKERETSIVNSER